MTSHRSVRALSVRCVLIAIVLGGMPVTIACGQREPPQAPEIPRPAPRIADGAWAGVLAEHPRLLGPRAHLQGLARAKPEAYAEVESQSDRDILATGVVRAVQGLDPAQAQRYVDRALRNVARGVTNTHQDTWIALTNVALAYDLFFDAIAPDDRAEMIEWLNGHLGRYTTDENAFHNSTLSKVLCYLRIAYATWGENERAREFRDHALVSLYEGKIVAVLREFGAGGGFTECGWYSRHSLWHLVQALELARRVEGYDGFQKAPRFFYQRLAYEMLQPYPGLWKEGYGAERYACEGDGSYVYGDHTEYPRDMRTVLAQYFRGSELSRAIANKRRKGSNFDARLVDFLYEEDPDAPLDLKGFPLAHLASGVGKVYARSDWTDDATWFRFECGDLWNHHQHFEVGNFEIFRREPLATESGEYHDYLSSHSVNWLLRTIAHNCILVYQPDETWSTMRDGGRNAYANDGGQTKKWEWVVDTVAAWKQRQEQFELGSIVGYENRPEFLFVAGDCTKAYAPSKLAAWVRQIVFVRPHTFVIFDRVLSTRPEYEKTWLLHCRYEPQIAGNTTTIANGAGRLTVQTLLPERPVVRKVEGYTYRGQTFDPPQTGQSATANRWRVEVLPPEAQTEDIFLHVLTTDEPQDATLLHEGGTIGARVGQVEVRFDGRVGGTLDIAGRQFPLAPEVRTGRYE